MAMNQKMSALDRLKQAAAGTSENTVLGPSLQNLVKQAQKATQRERQEAARDNSIARQIEKDQAAAEKAAAERQWGMGSGVKEFDRDRGGTSRGGGFGSAPGFTKRVESAAVGAGKQYGAGFVSALGTYLEGSQMNTTRELERKYEARKAAYEKMQADNLASPGTWSEQIMGAYQKDLLDMAGLVDTGRKAVADTALVKAGEKLQQTAGELNRSGAADIERAKHGLGGLGKFAVDVGVAGGQMGADILLGAATGGSALIPMAIRGFGSGAQEAREQGADTDQQFLYGAAGAATSVLVERLSNLSTPFAKAFGKGAADDILNKAIGKAAATLSKSAGGQKALTALMKAGTAALGEGAEEFLESAVDPILRRATFDPNAQFQAEEAVYNFLIGGALGAVGGGVETVTNLRKTEQTPQITEQEAAQQVETQNGQDLQTQMQTTAQSAQEVLEANTAGNLQESTLNLEESGRRYGVAEEVVQQVKRIADATQRKIVFFDEGETATGLHNGWYDPETGIIGINVRSKNPVAQVIGHELTHSVETAQTYRELSGLVLTRLQRDGKSLEELRSAKKEEYAGSGITLSTGEDIDREIVAEYVEKYLLTDEQRIMEFALNERSLAQKILDWINHLLTKIGVNLDQEREFLVRVREAYSEALAATPGGVSTNRRTVNDLRQAWANGEITDEEFDAALDDIMQDESRRGESPLELRHSYAGKNALRANEAAREDAERLEMQGADAETIRQQTGWFRGADRQWRWEIDDSGMEYDKDGNAEGAVTRQWAMDDMDAAWEDMVEAITPEQLERVRKYLRATLDHDWEWAEQMYQPLAQELGQPFTAWVEAREWAMENREKSTGGKLSDYIKHPELFANYPRLRNVSLRFAPMEYGRGYYNPATNEIVINENIRDKGEQTLIHEVQHVIQHMEGFATGANPEYWQRVQEGENPIRSNERKITETRQRIEQTLSTLPENIAEQFREFSQLEKNDEAAAMGVAEELGEGPYGEQFNQYFMDSWTLEELEKYNHRRGANDLYRNTAGEIEARDTAARLRMGREQRRDTRPDTGDENTVFAEDGGYAMSRDEQASIKEQLAAAQDRLNEMDAVARVNAAEIAGLNTAKAREKLVQELRKTGYRVDRKDFGVIQFEEKEINNSLNYKEKDASAEDARRAAFLALPQVLRRGIEISGHGNHKGRGYETITLAAPVEINGKRGNMAVVVKETKGNRYKVHRVLTPDGQAFILPEMANAEVNTVGGITDISHTSGEVTPTINSASKLSLTAEMQDVNAKDSAEPERISLPEPEGRKQYSISQPEGLSLPKPEETTASMVDRLPTKARKYLERTERGMVAEIGKALGIQTQDQRHLLEEAVREISEEYLGAGTVPQKKLDDLFNRVYDTGWSAFSADADRRKQDKHEFDAAVMGAIGDLKNVKRYAEDRQRKAELVKEKISMTQEEATQAYQQLKQARRDYEKAAAKNLLTEHDEQRIGELLRGQIQLENLDPKTDNVRGITLVYEARKEYEHIAKRLKEYKGELRKKGRERADGYLTTSGAWKDKSAGIFYSRETMERNIRDIVPDKKLANDIIREYFTPVHEAQAASTREKNEYRERVKKLNLSRKVAEGNEISEAHAVQLLGEAEDNIRVLLNSKGRMKQRDGKSLEDWQGIVTNLWEQNPSLDRAKINAAVKEFRDIYDELFGKMNEVRVRNGYEPVNYRQGYFPHFQPGSGDGILAQFGKIMGIDTQVIDLPTTINGMTHTFKPGITWFGNSQQRLGFATAYDAVEGFDKYIEGVMDVIHHTDNIQNLRALASQIRYRASDDGIREQMDAMRANDTLTEEQKEDQIAAIYEKGKFALSNFVAELDEYTNLLANKKSKGDRSMEQAMGRRAYIFMKNMESRVAANMVAINPGSWLTNFIPITQGAATIKTRLVLSGMWDTLRAVKENDGFADRSAFLTNRRGSDPLVKTWSENISANLTKPMEWIDNFTSEAMVRARYQHNLEHKMSEDAAMREADAWTASIMADRSKGATPTLFSQKNPVTKLFTQFQLEVNNQYSYLFKDLPDEVKERGLAVLAGAFFKFFLGAFLYNEVYEYFVGRRPALDPFGMLVDAVEDFQTEEVGTYEVLAGLGGDIAEQIPFVGGVLGGGRVPVSSAMPDVPNLVKAATDENWSAEKKVATVVQEMANPLSYLVLPFGGGQAKKIIQGVNAVNRRGSYSVDSEGNEKLQYPVFADTKGEYAANMLRATVFGKSSLPEAVDWVESGFKGLSAKETAAYQKLLDAGASGRDSYELLSQLDGEERNKAVADENLSDEATLDIFSELMSEGEYVRVGVGYEFGLSPKLYAQARYLMGEYNADGEGGIKQDEAETAIRSIDGLNTSQRAVLWQVQNKGWSGKSNPFSAKIGERVKEAFDAMNEDEELVTAPGWISLPMLGD